jgi:hypothetical protein
MVPEVGLFGVSRPGVAAINLTGVETNLAGVPSEAPNLGATSLPPFSVPPETELGTDFLLDGDEAADSAFASGLVVLAVPRLFKDLCENLLLKECDMCDIPTGCCSTRDGVGTADTASGTGRGVI